MYVGGVGQGKTALAVLACMMDDGDFVYTNTPLNPDYFPHKKIVEWTDLDEVEYATCGVWLMDEADMWLDSRKFSTLNDVARRKLKEHRKDDLRIISTTQHVSFVDRVFRILCDEVRVVKKFSMPFLGWFVPSAIRPTLVCKHCGRTRPDGIGDDSSRLKRWLGFATIYTWDIFPASVLGKDENANAQDTQAEESDGTDERASKTKRLGGGWKLFSMKFIGAYDTSCKTSQKADVAMKNKETKRTQVLIQRKADAKAIKDAAKIAAPPKKVTKRNKLSPPVEKPLTPVA